jgi:hypothetical protein
MKIFPLKTLAQVTDKRLGMGDEILHIIPPTEEAQLKLVDAPGWVHTHPSRSL